MAKVTGRTDDLMIVRGVNIFPTQVEELVLALPGLSPYFQCVLTRPGRLDELEVVVEAGDDLPAAAYGGLGGELAGRIKDRIGVTAIVRVVTPGGIERSVGKARRIVDHRTLPDPSCSGLAVESGFGGQDRVTEPDQGDARTGSRRRWRRWLGRGRVSRPGRRPSAL